MAAGRKRRQQSVTTPTAPSVDPRVLPHLENFGRLLHTSSPRQHRFLWPAQRSPDGGGRWVPGAVVAAEDEISCTRTTNVWDGASCTDANGAPVPVIIQQDKRMLFDLRFDIGYYNEYL